MVMVVREKMTAAEYDLLPETTQPTQLIDGELIEMASPALRHQRTSRHTVRFLTDRLNASGGEILYSPMDVHFDEFNVVQPDVFWIAPNGLCQTIEEKLYGAPDLIVEVLSPSTAKLDRDSKYLLYERYGVREYWLADPLYELVEVFQHREGRFERVGVYGRGDTFASPLVGTVPVDALFAPPA